MQSNESATQKPATTAQESGFKPPRYRGDRGNVFKRQKAIAGRSPQEMGIKKRKVPRTQYYAFCDHRNPKNNKRQCSLGYDKKPFVGWTVFIVMGNKASHEIWHKDEDAKVAEF